MRAVLTYRPTFIRYACSIVAVTMLLAAPAPAHAQGAQPGVEDAEGRAKALFAAGRDAFNAGDYHNALVRWQEAWELSPRPELLYNIGLSLDRLRHDQGAIAAFESFLEELPNDPRGPEVRARIAAIREGIARTDASKQIAPEVAVPATAEPSSNSRPGPSQAVQPLSDEEATPWYGRWYTWAGVGAVAAVAVTLVVVATSSSTDTTRATPNSGVTIQALHGAP
jgi:tetratricopeptide (TPR) repeat protein